MVRLEFIEYILDRRKEYIFFIIIYSSKLIRNKNYGNIIEPGYDFTRNISIPNFFIKYMGICFD